MKISKYILLFSAAVFMTGCERTVGVDLDTTAPKLVVDAAINWYKGTDGHHQEIMLTTTTGYFSGVIPTVSGADVVVENSGGTEFIFNDSGNGKYVCDDFIPQIGETYTLTIHLNGKTLTASETLEPVVLIDKIEQESQTGISTNDNRIDIKTYFTDPGNTNNFYMSRFQSNINAIPEYQVTDDEFFQGNQVFDLYFNPDIVPGDTIEVRLYGISERYFNYMTILTTITGNAGGGPFATPPATLHGNIVNTSNSIRFGFGLF